MKISKKNLDEVISVTREYWKTGDTLLLDKRHSKADKLAKSVGIWWDAVLYILDGVLIHHGFKPDATNEEIYAVLGVLGWEVTDEIQESESL